MMNWWQPPVLYYVIATIVVLSIPAFLLRKWIWAEIKRWRASEVSFFGIKLVRKANDESKNNKKLLQLMAGKTELPVAVPEKRYKNLFGREEEINSILASLRDAQAKRLIAVIGMGGIGKSALTREVVERVIQEKLFSACWWITAKQQSLDVMDDLSPDKNVSYETLFKRLAAWLGLGMELHKETTPEQREMLVKRTLSASRLLLVLDNLETSENQDRIAERFANLLNGTPSRAILTSREDFTSLGNLLEPHTLKGLGASSSVQLMQDAARENNSKRVASTSESALRKIAQAVGGMPLALKMSVGLLEFLETAALVEDLEKIQSEKVKRLYEYLFARAWRALSNPQKDMLIAISSFDENEGVRARLLRQAQVVEDEHFADVIQRLVSLSLIEVSGGVTSTRYTLHPLTLNFIRSQDV